MDCPKCGLINPEYAQRCDCGYDFRHGVVMDSYLHADQQQGSGNIGVGVAAGFFGGLIGLGIVYGTTEAVDTRKGAVYGLVAHFVVALIRLALL